MIILKSVGNTPNMPTNEYIAESLEELNGVKDNTPFGSTAMVILTNEVKFYVLNSSKVWKEIK